MYAREQADASEVVRSMDPCEIKQTVMLAEQGGFEQPKYHKDVETVALHTYIPHNRLISEVGGHGLKRNREVKNANRV